MSFFHPIDSKQLFLQPNQNIPKSFPTTKTFKAKAEIQREQDVYKGIKSPSPPSPTAQHKRQRT
jgi:hypothetical protein